MDLRYDESEERFRSELIGWLSEAVPIAGPRPSADDYQARRIYDTGWQRTLYEAGYAGIHWPEAFGGRGATPTEYLIFLEETTRMRAPAEGVNFVGLLHAGPTIIMEGTQEQRERYLPAILRGEEIWCQGFSEPGAGSDLASLSTRAVRDGDEYVVSGQKIWTSFASVADQCELLVRTDPAAPKHKGLSWLIMPMDAQGIQVRPLRTIEGSAEFAELFLDDVRIPVTNRVGAENDGWRVAMVTFSFERGTSFVSKFLEATQQVDALIELARTIPCGHGTAWDDPGLQRQVAAIVAELDALWALTKRNVTRAARGLLAPTSASAFKLAFAELGQRIGELSVQTLGQAGAARSETTAKGTRALIDAAVYAFSLSIAAGTSQIQRNIIAEKGLQLPREPA